MMITVVCKPGVNRAAAVISSIKSGIASRMSVKRMMTASIQPPKNPAAAPSVTPMNMIRTTAANPAASET